MYDFPASPSENDEFVPPVGGQTYIYKAPRWMVKGIPPIAGEGGGGIDEAPVDGQQYAREDAAWSVIEPGVSDWADIENKPATFPPTVPIPWTDVSGKPATFPPTVPIPWTDVSGKPATYPPTLPIAQADVTGLVAGQSAQDTAISGKAPTVHSHAKADITDLPAELTYLHNMDATLQTNIDGVVAVNTTQQTQINTNTADIATKANINSPTFTGDPKAPTPATADNDTSIATTAHVQANMALKANSTHTHAQADVTNLVTDLAAKAPLASPTFTGDARAVTPATSDNDTSIATTAYVKANLATIVGGATISDTAPGSPAVGQLWFESDTGNTFVWYTDANSSQWVQINTGIGAQGPAGPQGIQGIPGPWTQITQAAYDALTPPNPATLYVIVG